MSTDTRSFDWKWLLGFVVSVFACIGTYFGLIPFAASVFRSALPTTVPRTGEMVSSLPTFAPTATVLPLVMGTRALPTATPTAITPALPLREHRTTSIGTGVFADVIYSDGLAPLEEGWLQINHGHFQAIRSLEHPDGCGNAIYSSDQIWFSTSASTAFTVNGKEIGRTAGATAKHGQVFNWPVHAGDVLCAIGFASTGYQIVIGPDLYWHYDSYCKRGGC